MEKRIVYNPVKVGNKYGEWTVIAPAEDRIYIDKRDNSEVHQHYWLCQCSCGTVRKVQEGPLRSGRSLQCGKELKKNLIGQKFGRLTVISRADNKVSESGAIRIMYNCICDCGKNAVVGAGQLTSGKTKSCGCLLEETRILANFHDVVGQKYEHLTAIRNLDKGENGRYQLECLCDCGRTTIINRDSWGKTKSCGCIQFSASAEARYHDLVNQRFGMLIVVEDLGYDKSGKRVWKCKCDCGTYCEVLQTNLITGHTLSCGCTKSHGERVVGEVLRSGNLDYKPQYSFDDLVSDTGRVLRFDFGVLENDSLKYLIEYDGIQHFQDVEAWGDSAESTQKNDILKNEYCLAHGIPLIRIPYTHFDNITIEDLRPETSRFLVA